VRLRPRAPARHKAHGGPALPAGAAASILIFTSFAAPQRGGLGARHSAASCLIKLAVKEKGFFINCKILLFFGMRLTEVA
jgi:hypothetical protein